ncbi:hypothetical protein DSM107007_27620 [Nostoc sp. PCC 7120 = FACHB-418]|nr:hypothetical protein DSM107007_27620 [Nostoc sp. PCC 7120 = FACHB-418]
MGVTRELLFDEGSSDKVNNNQKPTQAISSTPTRVLETKGAKTYIKLSNAAAIMSPH